MLFIYPSPLDTTIVIMLSKPIAADGGDGDDDTAGGIDPGVIGGIVAALVVVIAIGVMVTLIVRYDCNIKVCFF